MTVPTTDYTIDGSTVVFNTPRSASESLDLITHSTGATMTSIAETDVAAVSPAAAADLNIVIDATPVPTSDYTVSGSTVVFDTPRSASQTLDTLTHSGGEEMTSMTSTEVAAFTPTAATGKLTVEIDNVLQAPSTYTINGNQITFNEAKPASATMTAFLHSEETEYSFDITATDTENNEESQRAFSMFVNKPGIAFIAPKRGVSLVEVAYNTPDSPAVPLAAATYNQNENITLSLTAATAGNLAGSGLTFTSTTDTGTVEGGLEGSPESLEEDTEFEITVKAVETGNASYNHEKTLTITILQDPIYFSPAT
jgi:hypothetical protein